MKKIVKKAISVILCAAVTLCSAGAAVTVSAIAPAGVTQASALDQAIFMADGEFVAAVEYTAGDAAIEEPEVPEKLAYEGAWEDYELTAGGITVNAVYTPIVYHITFMADGNVVDVVEFSAENTDVVEPEVPAKADMNGAWENYSLSLDDFTVNAVYTPVTYEAVFCAFGRPLYTVEYAKGAETIEEPAFYELNGYEGHWEDYTLVDGGITVNAVYTPITYTVTFVADGTVIDEIDYTIESKNITVPEIPQKEGFNAAWESFRLRTGDITVNAVYTPEINTYIATFMADGVVVGYKTFTTGTTALEEPEVPAKKGYAAAWETYTLGNGDITVNAVYTMETYTITFVANGTVIDTQEYTLETESITAPAVPAAPYRFNGVWENYDINCCRNLVVEAIYQEARLVVTSRITVSNTGNRRISATANFPIISKTYVTSDSDIASVDAAGNITAVAPGKCKVTVIATGKDDFGNTVTARATVTVTVRNVDENADSDEVIKNSVGDALRSILHDFAAKLQEIFFLLSAFSND